MSGFLIWGTVDPERTERRGFFARLLGRRTHLRVLDLGGNRKLIDLPTEDLQPLVPALAEYILRRTGQPWPATRSILSYIGSAIQINLRGESQGDAPPIFYVQLTFTDRARTATVSSEVATHWARRWFDEEPERVASILRRGGLTPTRASEPESALTFLPVGDLGYAGFRLAADGDEDEDCGPFALDAAIAAGNGAGEDTVLRQLTERWTPFMSDGRCHCQFCDPGFDQGRLATDLPAR